MLKYLQILQMRAFVRENFVRFAYFALKQAGLRLDCYDATGMILDQTQQYLVEAFKYN